MKKCLIIIITLLSYSLFGQNSNKNLLADKTDSLIQKEVDYLLDKNVKSIIYLSNNSGYTFILWKKNESFRGKIIDIQDVDSFKSKKIRLNRNIRDLFSSIINEHQILREIKTDFCNPRARKCGRLNFVIYKNGEKEIEKKFYLTFKSKEEEEKMKYFLDLYGELYNKI